MSSSGSSAFETDCIVCRDEKVQFLRGDPKSGICPGCAQKGWTFDLTNPDKPKVKLAQMNRKMRRYLEKQARSRHGSH